MYKVADPMIEAPFTYAKIKRRARQGLIDNGSAPLLPVHIPREMHIIFKEFDHGRGEPGGLARPFDEQQQVITPDAIWKPCKILANSL